jgi:N,N-dimethylformamidase
VPFVVRPAPGATTRPIAFVVPTTTYGAYANMHLRVSAQFNELAHARLTVLDSTDLLLLGRPELGKSTYDVHRDGSPVLYSSMNRPVTNFRPTGRMYKFCQDLMITDWLDGLGIDVDVITDDDLHAEGVDALRPYRVAITGSHPEYLTRAQFDAFEEFTRAGGRLMYLGGNGFYSAAEIPGHRLDVTEVRRPGQDNLWRVNHAEGLFSTSGRPGGMWRNIGRPENAVTGVGFITQGFDACTFYSRTPASFEDRTAWIFEGLAPDEVIGDFGVLQGGAAGYEIDRHEVTKGSPPHSVVVASSGGHSNVYDLMVPSILDTLPDPGRTQDPIRADMVFFETDHGGAVFSVGSIAWSGSLGHREYDNSVSRVTANVLRRFVDPAPFVPPANA